MLVFKGGLCLEKMNLESTPNGRESEAQIRLKNYRKICPDEGQTIAIWGTLIVGSSGM